MYRRIRFLARGNKRTALMIGIMTFLLFYFRMKYRNVIGTLDGLIVKLFVGLLVVMATVDIYDVLLIVMQMLKGRVKSQ